MTEKSEEKQKSKDMSRREFLKDAGLVVGGAAVGSMAVLSACTSEKTITNTMTNTTTATVTSPAVTTTATITQPVATVTTPPVTKTIEVPVRIAAAKVALSWDEVKCTGCEYCIYACSTVHEGATSSALGACPSNSFSQA